MAIRKIALISFHTSPLATLGGKDTGGMNVFVRETARELAHRNIAVDVFTRSQSAQSLRVDPRIAPNARVIHVPAGPEEAVPKRELWRYVEPFTEWLRRFSSAENEDETTLHRTPDGLDRRPYDLIHSHYWLSGLVADNLRQCWGTRYVHTFHTLAELKNQIAESPDQREPVERLRGELSICSSADLITASTKVEQQQLAHYYGASTARIRVVPPGVDTAKFHPIEQSYAKSVIGAPQAHRMVLFAGRIEPLKGIDTLFRAMAIVSERLSKGKRDGANPGFDLCVAVIGGDPSETGQRENVEMARLHALRNELGLNDLITFIGARDQDTLQYYYSAADCLVMPSHYESFGMVALEAMACGTPVVVSDVGGLSQLVRHNQTGFKVQTKDVSAMADAIERLLTNEVLRRRMGYRASCYAEDYSWSKIVDRLMGVYEELI
ncbi:MAG: glycosyltransferase [Chloroflexi bacterium]|nr:glycosyltransferase [Chloroflexota bacterium]MCL5273700.1 glycosyltransferase [Chloroflexota bacterium]